jgi:hypothetical protein
MKKSHWVTHMKRTVVVERNGRIGFAASTDTQRTACGIDLYYGTLTMKEFKQSDTKNCDKCEAVAADLQARAKRKVESAKLNQAS